MQIWASKIRLRQYLWLYIISLWSQVCKGDQKLRNKKVTGFHDHYCTYLRVGGITALRALSSHQSLVPPLTAWPLVYTVMTAPVHVQCLSCCLGNLWAVMAAVSVVNRMMALTPHTGPVINMIKVPYRSPAMMGLIPWVWHQILGADHVRLTLSLARIFMARVRVSVKEFLNHETDDEQMMVTHISPPGQGRGEQQW